MKKLVFTCGDINGIGPEIVVKAVLKIFDPTNYTLILAGSKDIFINEIKKNKLSFELKVFEQNEKFDFESSKLNVVDLGNYRQELGEPTAESGIASFNSISKAFELLKLGFADAMITAPISKHAIKLAGIDFPGHTEMLAQWDGTQNYSMSFLSDNLKVAIATIHEPLKDVADMITFDRLKSVIDTNLKMMKSDLNISDPSIAVLGLNPHAGENGKIGSEEKEIILPVVKSYESKSIQGPFVPDAFFANKLHKKYDLVIGMYHDQVLIPFKLINFDLGVNYTAGLNIIRTSPDHGTAFDIAGKNIANEKSIIEAFNWACRIVDSRKRNEKQL